MSTTGDLTGSASVAEMEGSESEEEEKDATKKEVEESPPTKGP